MSEDTYKDWLADAVIAKERLITYRLLSRALKVNVNTAKHMLYEFHTTANAKRPNSVHATYLLTGKKHDAHHTLNINGRDGDDTVMRSSPFMSSLPEPEEPAEKPVTKTSIVLAREEELDKTKAQFAEITSIHIYSLESGPIENLNLLTTCNLEIAKTCAKEDPLERWRVYGSIHNPYIKKRAAKVTPSASKSVTTSTTKPIAKPATKAAEKPVAAPVTKEKPSDDGTSGQKTAQPKSAGGTLKRSDSKTNAKKEKVVGDIFKSFQKAKAKPKEAAKSKEPSPAPEEDEKMQGMSEDEGDADDAPQVKFDEEKAAAARKARAEREEELRKMMEADGQVKPNDMPDAPPAEEMGSEDAPIDQAAPSKPAESESTVTVSGGRRRGRRKVTKKVKKQDKDGYLVTVEETGWESFSEEEPAPKKPKPAPKSATTGKGKKAGPKGQGSIASFFKKA
ncbi:hypothetical protein BS50DRAFT_603630 [Corynespora cassiicola Philippines]|uniref:DNA polymerase delta subunit 3 n=1 Tax=Corynespora cassiicola Philippines TaxID=1448308 RepID=A0A2T2N9I0_CORCC|nr:hypothetical protein BS50DRAFT_603630 [Corynespora cassiicola Philippines]